jgi:hypothetical protein
MSEKMRATTAEITAIKPPDSAVIVRRCVRVDGRSKAAKRVKALAAGYTARLGGGADAATLAAVQKAAELGALAEELRGKALRGEGAALSEVLKLEGVADRAVRALGLDRKRTPVARTLASYLAARNTERSKEESELELVEETGAEASVHPAQAAV